MKKIILKNLLQKKKHSCQNDPEKSSTEKKHSCQNDPEKSSTKKKAKHIHSGYSLFISYSFDPTKNKRNCYRGKDCIEKFCKDWRNQAMEIINYEKKEMIPLTDRGIVSYEKQKDCHIYEKEFCTDKNDKSAFKIYHNIRHHCHYTGKFRGTAHHICNLR